MIELIVGLANPGREYQDTRHNAGAWFVEALAQEIDAHFRLETKLKARLSQVQAEHGALRLAIPTVYMNESGQSLAAILRFYKINAENTLIVHDDIDLPPGSARLKFAGGEGGHNGLRSIVNSIGSKNFYRLRIGVGHPGTSKQVVNYVLKRPTKYEQQLIDDSIHQALAIMSYLLKGEVEKAMCVLHTKSSST